MAINNFIGKLISILIPLPERHELIENFDYLIVDDRFQKDVINKIGMLDDFNKGAIKCSFCSKTVNESNLRMIIPRDEVTSDLMCDSVNCYDRYLRSFSS